LYLARNSQHLLLLSVYHWLASSTILVLLLYWYRWRWTELWSVAKHRATTQPDHYLLLVAMVAALFCRFTLLLLFCIAAIALLHYRYNRFSLRVLWWKTRLLCASLCDGMRFNMVRQFVLNCLPVQMHHTSCLLALYDLVRERDAQSLVAGQVAPLVTQPLVFLSRTVKSRWDDLTDAHPFVFDCGAWHDYRHTIDYMHLRVVSYQCMYQ